MECPKSVLNRVSESFCCSVATPFNLTCRAQRKPGCKALDVPGLARSNSPARICLGAAARIGKAFELAFTNLSGRSPSRASEATASSSTPCRPSTSPHTAASTAHAGTASTTWRWFTKAARPGAAWPTPPVCAACRNVDVQRGNARLVRMMCPSVFRRASRRMADTNLADCSRSARTRRLARL